MEPGKEPEVFIKDCKTFKAIDNGGWLYYVENNKYNIISII